MPQAVTCLEEERGGVLVASPNGGFRKRILKRIGHLPTGEAQGGAEAMAMLESSQWQTLLLDLRLSDLDAQELAGMIHDRHPHTKVLFMDSDADQDPQPLFDLLQDRGPVAMPLPDMIGSGEKMNQVYRRARLVAPRNATVLLTGETGTGKELVAMGIHKISPRAANAFVVVNCAAIPEALLEAELFGYARGAFTGAFQSRLGRVHTAHGGVLFLDEVGDLPLSMQAKLLRFLQEGEVQRLGSPDLIRVDVRVIAATNTDLEKRIADGQFRQDLYYRIAVFPLLLPPLRERTEDIEALARYFLQRLGDKHLSSATVSYLEQQKWPGNARELQHAIERAWIMADDEPVLRPEHFHLAI